jgi:hypothetical protein
VRRNKMSTGYLPESITKDILFERAQERFQSWAKMYGDPNTSAQWMYEDMSASCYCGAPQDDFPEIIGLKKEEPVKESATSDFFKYRGITFRVTCDETDDKEYIWCDKFQESDELVDWTWGTLFCGTSWVGGTVYIDRLDKFIDAHEKEE